ncbi:hypothetical protein EPA93_18585 [Ktedonosporobacter rubrisoli]|uniref:General stress protein 17M-like domain-containing protein n=1 Tax=Ktedonosporobacter rubrisoli TaxID=2509675 RepID=A0A4V0YYZ0_KTERU|nr:general stress protein [Ktedonosporobacter rubrisoli]QBD77891.1 hypothetical protein EPA93_18585 [Ktedonosporobacter rubrisoli]
MTANPHSAAVGVFKDRSMAEQAVNALLDAGFSHDQIRYATAGSSSGGFFNDLKSMFSTSSVTGSNLVSDLSHMGLSNEEARFYANEYENGNSIVAVNAPGHEQDAMNVLHKQGAYNYYHTVANAAPTGGTTQEQPVNTQTPGRYATPSREDELARQRQAEYQAAQGITPGREVRTGESRKDATAASTRETQLQDLRAQLEATQQQLQAARTRLQAAKEHEAQIRSARESEAEFEATRKQLQDAQTQLQSTLAELRETEARLGSSTR